jgi:cell division septal protein FtsQ
MAEARRVSNTGRPKYGSYSTPPPRKRSKAPRPTIHLPWRWIALGGGIVLVIWFLWTRFTVSQVNVTTILRSQEVKSEVLMILSKDVRQGNLITINTARIASDLAVADPALRNITVTRSWPSGIRVEAVQKQPALGWSTGNQKYLLDRDGTIIGLLPASSQLTIVTDGSNLPVTIGQRVVTASFVSFCTDTLSLLPANGITVTGLSVRETTFDLYVQTAKGYYLIFDTKRYPADEIADLKQVLITLNGKVPIQYIDMRINGKAYYK